MSQMEVDRVYETPEGTGRVHVRESARWVSPGRVIGFMLGVVLAFVGVLTLVKTGVSSDLSIPQVDIFGMTHSPAIGLIELGGGLLLILAAASEATRPLMGFVGVLLFVGGIVGAVSSFEIRNKVGFGPNTGWFFALCGFIAIVAAMLPAVWTQRREVEELT